MRILLVEAYVPRADEFTCRALTLSLRGHSCPDGVSGVEEDILFLCWRGECSGEELQGLRAGGGWTTGLFLPMATGPEGVCSTLLSHLPAGTQARWAASEMLRGDRVLIAGWYRPFPRCPRAPSSLTRVFSHPKPGGMPRKEFQQQSNLGPSV